MHGLAGFCSCLQSFYIDGIAAKVSQVFLVFVGFDAYLFPFGFFIQHSICGDEIVSIPYSVGCSTHAGQSGYTGPGTSDLWFVSLCGFM